MSHVRPLPKYAKKGSPVEAADFNAIIEVLRSLDISSGPGISVKKSSNGITISVTSLKSVRGSGGGGGGGPGPFDVSVVDVDGTDFSASVWPGTVNGLIASGHSTPTTLAYATTYYLVLSLTATDGEITGAALSFETTPPDALPVQQGVPPVAFTYLIGLLVNGEWFRTIGEGSLSAVGVEVFRADKDPLVPGTVPYDIYWSWALST